MRAVAQEGGDAVQGRLDQEGLAARVRRAVGKVRPGRARGQVDLPPPRAGLRHGRDEHVRAVEVFVLAVPGRGVVGEFEEERADDGRAGLVRLAHQFTRVGAHGLAHGDQAGEDRLALRAVGPDLVVRAAVEARFAGLRLHLDARVAHAVQAHDRAEEPPLEPADEQLVEGGVAGVGADEAADVRGPPGDAGKAHVQPGADLLAQGGEVGVHVAGPDERAVAGAAGPGAAQEVDDLLLSLALHALVEGAGVGLGIEVAGLGHGPGIVAVVVKVIGAVFRLGLVQPEDAHAVVVVVLLDLAPEVGAGVGVGGVKEQGVLVHKAHLAVHALVAAGEEALLVHLPEVLALERDLRPDGDHQLHAHGLELLDHGLGIGPELLVKAEVAHVRPVEEVHDDHVHGDAAAVVLARDVQELLLVPIAQLALPEAQAVLGHLGRVADGVGVLALDVAGGVAGADPVVHLLGALGGPLHEVAAKARPADGGIVPEEAVALVGEHKGHARLGIALGQLKRGVLDVEHVLLVLAHAVELFPVVGGKAHGELEVPGHDGLEEPGLDVEGAGAGALGEQDLAPGVVVGDLQAVGPVQAAHHRGEVPYADGGLPFADLDGDGAVLGLQQRPGVQLRLAHGPGQHAQRVLPPGQQPEVLPVQAALERAVVVAKKSHVFLSFAPGGRGRAVCRVFSRIRPARRALLPPAHFPRRLRHSRQKARKPRRSNSSSGKTLGAQRR